MTDPGISSVLCSEHYLSGPKFKTEVVNTKHTGTCLLNYTDSGQRRTHFPIVLWMKDTDNVSTEIVYRNRRHGKESESPGNTLSILLCPNSSTVYSLILTKTVSLFTRS